VDHGALSPDQAKQHPYGNVIRRYLGSHELPEPDFRLRLHEKQSDTDAEKNQGMVLKPNDKLILCSDGLTDLVEDQEILENVSTLSEDLAVKHLINLANKRGGRDNITVIIIRTPEE
jgi:protein phosphatase